MGRVPLRTKGFEGSKASAGYVHAVALDLPDDVLHDAFGDRLFRGLRLVGGNAEVLKESRTLKLYLSSGGAGLMSIVRCVCGSIVKRNGLPSSDG